MSRDDMIESGKREFPTTPAARPGLGRSASGATRAQPLLTEARRHGLGPGNRVTPASRTHPAANREGPLLQGGSDFASSIKPFELAEAFPRPGLQRGARVGDTGRATLVCLGGPGESDPEFPPGLASFGGRLLPQVGRPAVEIPSLGPPKEPRAICATRYWCPTSAN